MEPLRFAFDVACSPARAFALWTEQFGTWWPPDHTQARSADTTVVFQPGVGGRIFERTARGTEHDWGEVTVWDPPHRVVYLWHLMADRSDATEVVVTFQPRHGRTSVTIEHRGWERLGASGPERRRRNRQGWSGVLDGYRGACAG